MTNEEKKQLSNAVCEEVCSHFGVSVENIRKKDITKKTSLARYFIFYILHRDFGLTTNFISCEYRRHVFIVFKGCAKIGGYLSVYSDMESDHRVLLEKIQTKSPNLVDKAGTLG